MCVKVFGNVLCGTGSVPPPTARGPGVHVGGVGVSDVCGVRAAWLLSLEESWAERVRHSGTPVGPVL